MKPKTVFIVSYVWDFESEPTLEAIYATRELAERHPKGGNKTIIEEFPILTKIIQNETK